MRKFIYAEDNQMYFTDYYLVETNYFGSPSELEDISWSTPEAGRFSTSVQKMKELVEKRGFRFKIVKMLGKDLEKIPEKFKDYPIIKGATGNY